MVVTQGSRAGLAELTQNEIESQYTLEVYFHDIRPVKSPI